MGCPMCPTTSLDATPELNSLAKSKRICDHFPACQKRVKGEILDAMNSTQSLQEGTQVLILETPNVMLRHPELVGSVGEVADAAVHPATWFTVRVADGRLLKFQPTALRPVDGAKAPKSAAAAKGSPAAAAAEGKQGKADARAEQRIVDARSPPAARMLTKGTQVAIQGTDNVQQRVPHLIGRVGVVKEAPVHPATWYKVEFDDGRVYTFRPSALRVLSGERRRRAGSDLSEVEVGRPPSERSDSVADNSMLLSAVDPDLWINKVVRIRGGRQAGQTGTVLRSGNGWVQLDTSVGEVAKRAYELELLDDAVAPMPAIEAEAASAGDQRRSRAGRRLRATSIGTEDEFQLPAKRSRRESVEEQESVDDRQVPEPQPTPSRAVANKRSRAMSDVQTEFINGVPLVSIAQRMERAEILKKFIDRQFERVKNRPNLKNVVQQLAAVSYNPEHEKRMARDLLDNFCPLCFQEKLPTDKFCWNWECAVSPIFRDLPRLHSHKESVYTDDAANSDDTPVAGSTDVLQQEPQIMDVCTYLALAPTKTVGGEVAVSSSGMKRLQNFSEDSILFRWQKWACSQPEEADIGADLEQPESVALQVKEMKPPLTPQTPTTTRRRQSIAESDSGRSSHEDTVSQEDDHATTSDSSQHALDEQHLKHMHPADIAAASALAAMPGAHSSVADFFSSPTPSHNAGVLPAPQAFQRPLAPLSQALPSQAVKYPEYPPAAGYDGYDGYHQPPAHYLNGHLYRHQRY